MLWTWVSRVVAAFVKRLRRQQRLTQVVAVAQMTWQHSASWSGILITQILSDLAQEIVDYFCFCQHEVIFLVWWFLVDQSWRQRGKRQIKSIWKYFPHASFKQYTANLYFVSSNRVDELETDSNQIGATAKCATHTGRCDHRGILAGWVGS